MKAFPPLCLFVLAALAGSAPAQEKHAGIFSLRRATPTPTPAPITPRPRPKPQRSSDDATPRPKVKPEEDKPAPEMYGPFRPGEEPPTKAAEKRAPEDVPVKVKATPEATPAPARVSDEKPTKVKATPEPPVKATPEPPVKPTPEPPVKATPAPPVKTTPAPTPKATPEATPVPAKTKATPEPPSPPKAAEAAPEDAPAKVKIVPEVTRNIRPAKAAGALPEILGASNTSDEPARAAIAFFSALQRNQIDEAYSTLVKGSRISETPEEVRTLKAKTAEAIELFGPIRGYEMIESKAVGSNLTRRTYISLGRDFPLRWRFYFYRSSSQWNLLDLRVDDRLSGIFDEPEERTVPGKTP